MNKVSLDANRASLPAETVKLFGDPSSHDDIPVWLFLVDVGHLRVIADASVQTVLGGQLQGTDALNISTQEERQRLAALRMRLFSTSIKPVRRLVIPAEVFDACEEELDRKHLWIDSSAGFLDIYTITYRQMRLTTPPSKLVGKIMDQ